MAEDDIRLKDALIGIAAIIAMHVLLVVTVFVMLKAGLATRGLGTVMPVALACSFSGGADGGIGVLPQAAGN